MQVKQLLRYPKKQNETYHASEVKAKNKVFALYFTRFALSLHTKKDKGSHNPRNNLIIKNFIINIAL